MNYNNLQAPSNDDRWAITVRSIKDLCGSRHEAIKKFLEEHRLMVDDHNNKYDLSLYHNQRHGRQNVKISDVITW